MEKRLVGILVLALLIGTAVLPIVSSFNDDKVDQQQTETNYGSIPSGWSFAQSFKPTLPILTRVEIQLGGNYKCSIRTSLTGHDLTSVIQGYPFADDWHFFDFPDIEVITEYTYYIILVPQDNNSHVCYGDNTAYSRGSFWRNEGESWVEYQDPPCDLGFKTYGYEEEGVTFDLFACEPIGQATLIVPKNELIVSSLGPEGDDGVSILPKGEEDFVVNIYPGQNDEWDAEIGSELKTDYYGMVEDVETLIGSTKMKKKIENRWQCAVDIPDVNEYKIEGYQYGELVFSTEISGEGFTIIGEASWEAGIEAPPPIYFDYSFRKLPWGGSHTMCMEYSWFPTLVSWTNLTLTPKDISVSDILVDKIFVSPIEPIPEFEQAILTKMEIFGSKLNQFSIVDIGNIGENNPPSIPLIIGETSGKSGNEYGYTISTTDTNDEFAFFIDWGDETNSGWLGAYRTDDELKLSHKWNENGYYTIRVKGKDIYCGESDWATLEVAMPKNKPINKPFLNFLENHPYLFPLLQQLLESN